MHAIAVDTPTPNRARKAAGKFVSGTLSRAFLTSPHDGDAQMGHVFTPPLDIFVRFCASDLGVKTFVETGTFLGNSAKFASDLFPSVVTIYNRAKAEDAAPNIEHVLGKSEEALMGALRRTKPGRALGLNGRTPSK
jgi:hypothetical protein